MRLLSPFLPRIADRRGRIALLAVAIAAAAMLLGSNPPRADALCIARPEYGAWINANRTSPGIASLRLIQGDSCGTFARVWGKCSPTNCAWGQVRGSVTSSGKLYAYYDQGFAKRKLWAKMSGKQPGKLWVYWETDFVDPNRADYSKHEWFVRAS
jgi:hypothetical protein